MIVRTYAVESLLYRTAGLIDARIDGDAARRRPTARRRSRRSRNTRRGVDREGRRQRDARLRPRREHPDPRRQRLRARLPGRAPLPRRAREPHLRRHQRDQPPADPGHADPPRASRATCRSSRRPRRCRTSCSGRRRMPADRRRRCSPTSGARSTAFKKAALMVFGLAMQTYGAEAHRRAGSADAPRRHR